VFAGAGVLGGGVLASAALVGALRPGSGVAVPGLGVYAGPGAKGVAAAAQFAAGTGRPLNHVLDFASAKDWTSISGPSWLLEPHEHQPATLEYSLPMMPETGPGTLASCARGRDDPHWRTLAEHLVGAGLANTIVRPGWEFNGSWYSWSAHGRVADYQGCFRAIVTAMRSVPGAHLRFDWNPNLGAAAIRAERAYPGDRYVDFIGVDIYDTRPWRELLDGDHGLAFWSRFAAAHHKPMAIPEWGLVPAAGNGRGDDPAFVDHMFRFMTDRDHHVAYEQYFDSGAGQNDHRLWPGFPRAANEFVTWMHTLGS
jgi:Glycosyl hydrolase family 26